MANYVYNYLWVKGDAEHIQAFNDHIEQRPRFYWKDSDYTGFSLHSFITPPDSVSVEEYTARVTWEKDDDGNVTRTNNTMYNQENWNGHMWDTGCDALDVEVVQTAAGHVRINFQTKWSPPIKVIEAMGKQFPSLEFLYEYEEETGWGGKIDISHGHVNNHTQYDEPNSHQDFVDRDNEDGCICAYDSDEDNWYDDCPREDVTPKRYKVVTTHTHYVEAIDMTLAMQAVTAYENTFDMPDNTKMLEYDLSPQILVTEDKEGGETNDE